MVEHYAMAIGASTDVIMRAYDKRTEDAIISLVQSMPTDIGINLLDDIANLGDEASTHWQAIVDGNDEPIDASGRAVDGRGYPRAAITPADGEDDPEHPDSKSLGRTLRIQSYITAVVDSGIRDDLRQQFETIENHTAVRRIDELTDANVCHTWLWHLSKHHGPVLTSEEYLEAVRVRLGCAGPTDPVPCSRCGQALFDSSGAHAACCACPESTRGHYGVVKELLPRFQQCDPTAESEVTGLIPGTDLRPADILTQALGNTVTALDVGITSPDSTHAGTDCAASMFQRKMDYYRPYFGVLEQQNIEYIPLTWSSYGRPHSSTVTVLRTLSKRISRRRGTTTAAAVYHSMQSAIATEIWRRSARQVFWCWPGGERESDDAG